MKRTVGCILAILMAFCVVLSGFADILKDDASVNGLDVVVVMDQSKSMRSDDAKRGNDIKGYRIDAVTMLTGMLDMENSRIALVPFAGEVMEQQVRDFASIKDNRTRDSFIDYVENNFRNGNLQANTNIGSALLKAVDLLNKRANKDNQGMIVLLTDGANEASTSSNTTYYFVDANGNIEKARGSASLDLEKETTDKAIELAVAQGYPVYPIALGANVYTTTVIGNGDNTFRNIAEKTGGESQHVEASSVSSLPGFFANALASKIGSSQQIQIQPVLVDPTNRTYELAFPVLNTSVLETNVAIQTCLLGNNSENATARIAYDGTGKDATYIISMYDNNGKLLVDGEDYDRFDSKYFSLFKIREIRDTQSTGIWKLRFDMNKGDPSQFTLNLLYNYRLRLNAEMTAPGTEIYKSDTLKVKAYFSDESDDNARPSTDKALYADHTQDPAYKLYDWATIRTTWTLKDENGAERGTGELKADQDAYGFVGDIDLKATGIGPGEYTLTINSVGAGLDRKIVKPITVLNHQPTFDGTASFTTEVNKVDNPDQWVEEQIFSIAKSSFTDRDGDPLTYQVKDADGAGILTCAEGEAFAFSTKYSGEMAADGRKLLASGTGNYSIECFDGFDTLTVPVQITVESGVQKALDSYEIFAEVTGDASKLAGSDQYWKNAPLTVTLKLKDKNGSDFADGTYLGYFPAAVKMVTADGKTENLPLAQDGNTYAYTKPEAEVPGEAVLEYSLGIFGKATKKIELVNHEPVCAAEEKDFGTQKVNVPGDDASWEIAPVETVLCSIADLVKDPDGDALDIKLEAQNNADQIVEIYLSDDGQNLEYRFVQTAETAEGAGNRKMLASGEATWNLVYKDPYMDHAAQIPLKITLASGVKSAMNDYTPVLTLKGEASPDGEKDHFKKNTAVKVSLALQKNDGTMTLASKEELEKYKTSVTVFNGTKNVVLDQEMVPDPAQENNLTYTISAEIIGNKAADYTVTANMFVFGDQEIRFMVPNTAAPNVVNSEETAKRTLYCNGVADWLVWLAGGTETPADDPARMVNVPAVFADQDGDQLTYGKPTLLRGEQVRTNEEEYETEKIALNGGSGDQYTLLETGEGTGLLNYAYAGRIVLKATDGDGVTKETAIPFEVISLKDRLLTRVLVYVVAFIALAIAIFLFIRIMVMPFFEKDLEFEVRENESIFATEEVSLPHSKDPRSVSKLVSLDVQKKARLSGKSLMDIKAYPSRMKNSVKVKNKCKDPNVEVTLDGDPVKGSKKIMSVGQELKIRNITTGDSITLVLKQKEEDATGTEGMGIFMGTDNDDFGWGDNESPKKKNKKSRKAKNTEPEQPDDDGFDF